MPNSIFDTIEIIPPNKITEFKYLCDSRFHVDMIENLFVESKNLYGLVIVLGEESVLYTIDEFSRYKKVERVRHAIPNNHRRGGQSQARIGRLRVEHIQRYVTMVNEACRRQFTEHSVTTIRRLILSGSGQKKEQVRDQVSYLNVETILLNYSTLEEVLENFDQILKSESQSDAKEIIAEIEDIMRQKPERLVFGNEIKEAYDDGRLEKIWICSGEMWKLENQKTSVIVVDHYYLNDFDNKIGLLWY